MVRTDTCRRGGRWHISRNVEPQQQTSNFSGVEQDACVSLRGPERNLGLRQRSQAETAQFETRRAGQLQIDFAQSRAWIGGEWADRIMYRLEGLKLQGHAAARIRQGLSTMEMPNVPIWTVVGMVATDGQLFSEAQRHVCPIAL